MQPPKRLVRSLPKVCRPLQLSNGVRTREQAGRRADRRGVAAIPEGTSKRWKRVAARVSDDKNGETEQHEEREGSDISYLFREGRLAHRCFPSPRLVASLQRV
jgi:hypothetical protein